MATISGVANLVVLNVPTTPTGVSVSTLTITSSVNAPTVCTAPCAKGVAFASPNANDDVWSSPFYDYVNNVIYVGDAKGVLHKFQNVFSTYYNNGTNTTEPNEITGGGTGSGWPQSVGVVATGMGCPCVSPLGNPVYDSVSGKVFVGIDAGNSGIASIPSGGGSSNVVKSVQLNKGNSTLSFDLLVDSSAGKVYVFTAHGNSPSSLNDAGGVAELPTSFTNATAAFWVVLGGAAGASLDSGYEIYTGAFDQIYYNGTGTTGNMYVCAPQGTSSTTIFPTLFRIPVGDFVSAGTGLTSGLVLGGTTTNNCSPVSEFYNTNGTAVDYIFASVTGGNLTTIGSSSGLCSSLTTGCLFSFDATAGTTPTAPKASFAAVSGTGGIVIDNNGATGIPTGGAEVYFSVIGSQSCKARTVGGATTSSSSKAITADGTTSPFGIFTAGDVGATITGTDVAGSTTISSVTSSTSATMSNNATAGPASVTFSVTPTGGCAIQATQAGLN
jgi:hypothetical protein